jgi:hypothetical protein
VWFEGRDLKSYAEPVIASELQEKEVYFSVQFVNREMLIPIIVPLVYLGKSLSETGTELYYFQDFEFYIWGAGLEATIQEDSSIHVRGPNNLKHIFEYERALESLMKCSLRRRNLQGRPDKLEC